jgi:multidrug transporter EmrE-like cation transporter
VDTQTACPIVVDMDGTLTLGVLLKWDVSKAYPLVGLGFVFTAAVGFLLGEQMTIARIVGITLICAGVCMVGQS